MTTHSAKKRNEKELKKQITHFMFGPTKRRRKKGKRFESICNFCRWPFSRRLAVQYTRLGCATHVAICFCWRREFSLNDRQKERQGNLFWLLLLLPHSNSFGGTMP